MPKRDPKVDTYIAEAAPFAKPILRRLRKIVHAGCPAVEETIKWGFPHFVYKGNIAGMAGMGLALVATHHDLAPAPSRELRIGA